MKVSFRQLYQASRQCRQGKAKGNHFAVNRLQRKIRQAGHHSYYLQLNIHNYFYSIHRSTLLTLLAKHLQRSLSDKKTTRHQARHLYLLSRVPLLQGLRKQLISYAWVAENGYAHHCLKHRQLAQLFITGVPS
jgi:hypothetical protein